ncbi:histidine kinase/DNA gyrase B/HSP90-like ATPase [Geodermatophilus tzadiensis]|uniref:Histidine kinase/DNA gyrase B/HSP90-like ATPase n=1 Tax=Geodermatophilus tzadiensis TaxID=1137988 RepID=A0A2T0T630_9ACTN|nr:GAF domain-containing protein [Geodermatophilus tzadiensis]PRY41128.1 histidine kinase/DNA gyrase B/HSP90-like ATPase [Geodermatophilus tzadiensis]
MSDSFAVDRRRREEPSGRALTPPGPEGPPTGGEPALAAAVRAAAAGGHLEATLRGLVEAAVAHVDATFGALGVLTRDGSRLDRFVIVGMDDTDGERIGRLPAGEGILGLLVDHPVPLRLDDLGAHPASVGFPDGHPPMHSFLGVPVCVRNAVFGHLYLTEKRDGGPFTEADEEAVLALAAAAGLAIENARLAEAAERGRAWVQAATEVSTALLSGADPFGVLQTVVERAHLLSGADLAGVLVAEEEDASALTIVAAAGTAADEVEGVRVPLEDTHVGRVHRTGVGELVDDIRADPVRGRHAPVAVELIREYRSSVIAPLGRSLGTLICLRRDGREPFDTEDLDALSAFAAQTAVALELARSQRRERRLQVQADRDRIARDLHDHVVQRLYATALSLDRVSRSLEDADPYAAHRVGRSVDELDATIAQIRSTIFGLHDGATAPAGLGRLLTDAVRQATEGSELQPDLRLRGDLDALPTGLATDVLAVVRELLSNVVRHAGATRVAVTVDAGDEGPHGEVTVVVTDDGRGLPAVSVRSGLANLAERAAWHHGRLATAGGPTGTQVTWTVPRPAP